jgi:hypothetical protein
MAATPIFSDLRINTGGNDYTSVAGVLWRSDAYFVGGRASAQTAQITNTLDNTLYQTGRSAVVDGGSFRYAIPVLPGTYTVKLHFAETWFVGGGRGVAGIGQRVFDVAAEGVVVLSDYDISATVGIFTADIQSFTVSVTDDTLDLLFQATANRPTINAIEVLADCPPVTPAAPPYTFPRVVTPVRP